MTTQGDNRGRGGRLRSQRGATLVEFAFIFPVFMTIVLGMFSGGVAYNRKIGMTNAAAEASRYGATLAPTSFTSPFPPPSTHGLDVWLVQVADAVEQNATGDLSLGVPGRSICVAYVHPDGTALDDTNHRFVRTTTEAGVNSEVVGSPGVRCFDDGRPTTERRVQIEVARDSPIQALFFSYGVTLRSRSVTRFEATSG